VAVNCNKFFTNGPTTPYMLHYTTLRKNCPSFLLFGTLIQQ